MRWVSRRSLGTLALCAVIASTGLYYAFFTGLLLAVAAVVTAAARGRVADPRSRVSRRSRRSARMLVNVAPSLAYTAEQRRQRGAGQPVGRRVGALRAEADATAAPGRRPPARAARAPRAALRADDDHAARTRSSPGRRSASSVTSASSRCSSPRSPARRRRAAGARRRCSGRVAADARRASVRDHDRLRDAVRVRRDAEVPRARGGSRSSSPSSRSSRSACSSTPVSGGGRGRPERCGSWPRRAAAIVVVGIADQTTPAVRPALGRGRAPNGARTRRTRDAARGALPEGSSVFQLPYAAFPDNDAPGRSLDYDGARPLRPRRRAALELRRDEGPSRGLGGGARHRAGGRGRDRRSGGRLRRTRARPSTRTSTSRLSRPARALGGTRARERRRAIRALRPPAVPRGARRRDTDASRSRPPGRPRSTRCGSRYGEGFEELRRGDDPRSRASRGARPPGSCSSTRRHEPRRVVRDGAGVRRRGRARGRVRVPRRVDRERRRPVASPRSSGTAWCFRPVESEIVATVRTAARSNGPAPSSSTRSSSSSRAASRPTSAARPSRSGRGWKPSSGGPPATAAASRRAEPCELVRIERQREDARRGRERGDGGHGQLHEPRLPARERRDRLGELADGQALAGERVGASGRGGRVERRGAAQRPRRPRAPGRARRRRAPTIGTRPPRAGAARSRRRPPRRRPRRTPPAAARSSTRARSLRRAPPPRALERCTRRRARRSRGC